MANHHCANGCLSQLSKAGHNYMEAGYVAMKQEDEPKCPDVELHQLESVTDVTTQVNAATVGKSGAGASRPNAPSTASSRRAASTATRRPGAAK